MKIEIYTDGACRGNQFDKNVGAWAYKITIIFGGKENILKSSDAVANTTNNIMELTAVRNALQVIKTKYIHGNTITVYSDSTYVVMGMNAWASSWINRHFKGVKNAELWKELIALRTELGRWGNNIIFKHVTGHSGNPDNEYVDKLCNEAMDKFEKEQT